MDTHQQWDIVTGIGVTALAVAAARAVETSRPASLAQDPFAARFVTAAQASSPMPTSVEDLAAEAGEDGGVWPNMIDYIAVRTRAFDDHFLNAARDGIAQAVILASGLDSRAFRLDWRPGTVVHEIDQPLVLDFKLRVLREAEAEPRCDHRPTGIDLRDDWAAALQGAGFDPTLPTAWLAEGLMPYLPPEAEENLLHQVHRLSAPGSYFAAEYFSDMGTVLTDPMMERNVLALGLELGDLLHSDRRPSPAERLAEQGWQTQVVTGPDKANTYGRALRPSAMHDNVRLVSAHLP
ncbi:SAM-dependent methyltransferase [Streptomyces sp. NPDC090442]|uniref:SAM-dependent methyltransferase n=1 Tax=Streptomyces sp. NPDC090442 TaxID=3365962 RepID=UPI0037FF1C22